MHRSLTEAETARLEARTARVVRRGEERARVVGDALDRVARLLVELFRFRRTYESVLSAGCWVLGFIRCLLSAVRCPIQSLDDQRRHLDPQRHELQRLHLAFDE